VSRADFGAGECPRFDVTPEWGQDPIDRERSLTESPRVRLIP